MEYNYNVITQEEMTNLESEYLELNSLNEHSVIETAAILCVQHLLKNYGPFSDDHIVICAGSGKNGAIGLAIAFHMAKCAKKISISMPLAATHNSTITNENRLKNLYSSIKFHKQLIPGDLYIDALLEPCNLSEIIKQPIVELINSLNNQTNTLIALDVPSGVNANTGTTTSVATQADLTMAIGCLRPIHKQQKYCGNTCLIDIGIPENLIKRHLGDFKKAS